MSDPVDWADDYPLIPPPPENPVRADASGMGDEFVVKLKKKGTPGANSMFLASDGSWVPIAAGDLTQWGGIVGDINNQTDLIARLNLKADKTSISAVGYSGQYNDLLNKPVLGTLAAMSYPGGTSAFLRADGTWQIPQDVYATWGNIAGNIANQLDLQTALGQKAPLANPVFTGNPRAPSPVVDNNSDSVATTSWFFGQAFNDLPVMDGTASSGDSTRWARGNHRHPTDTTRAPLDSPQFTGIPVAPTPPAGNDSQRLATTAFVTAAIAAGGGGGGGIPEAPLDGQTYGRRGSDATWQVVTGGGGSGDVVGPASSVDNRVALFSGTTGKIIKDSGIVFTTTGDTNVTLPVTGILATTTDVTNALTGKEDTIAAGTTSQYWRGDKTWQTLDKAAVGLGNVSNTAQVTSVSGTAPVVSSGGTTPTISMAAATSSVNGYLTSANWTTFNNKEPPISTGTIAQYWRGDKSWQTLNATAVGLGNVSNTAQVTSVTGTAPVVSSGGTTPAISMAAASGSVNGYLTSANWTTFNNKEPSISTGTTAQYWRGDKSWQTLDKAAVGLANVDNTSDANKPVSSATNTALSGKQATLVSGTNIKTVNGQTLLGAGDVPIPAGPMGPKAVSVASPTNTDNIVLFYAPAALTISEARGVIRGGTSVTYSVYSGPSRATITDTHVNAAVCNSTTSGNVATLADSTIAAGSWVWVAISAVSGTVTEFALSMNF